MPLRPAYTVCPANRIAVAIVQSDGGRALVVSRLAAVPEAAGREALRISVRPAEARALPEAGRP
jgi:hypothetical protein